jgi:hypothetical protein
MQAKSLNDLRNILSEEIEKIRDNKTTAVNANAITNAAGKILSTIKLELEYCKRIGTTPNIDFMK